MVKFVLQETVLDTQISWQSNQQKRVKTLHIRILLYTALEAGDILQIIAPDGYDFSGGWLRKGRFESQEAETPATEN